MTPRQQRIAGKARWPFEMIIAAEALGAALNPRRAIMAESLIEPEGIGWVAVFFEAIAQTRGVFDGKRCALREIRQHGVSGIAKKDDAAIAPMAESWETVKRPSPPLNCRFQ